MHTFVRWGSRFKRGVCHREKTSLKYDFLVNRFKRGFILYREDGLREHLSYTEYMGFREAVGRIKSAGGDACRVVTPSVMTVSVEAEAPFMDCAV